MKAEMLFHKTASGSEDPTFDSRLHVWGYENHITLLVEYLHGDEEGANISLESEDVRRLKDACEKWLNHA